MTKTEYLKLLAVLERYNYEYHTLSAPSVDDAVYDSLMSKIKAYEKQNPQEIAPFSLTQRVGAAGSEAFQKVEHPQPMLGLKDVFSWPEVEQWQSRLAKIEAAVSECQYFVDLKMDGLALSVTYENGFLSQAVTRGDGDVGEDVTANAKTICNLPLRLPQTKEVAAYGRRLDIRGEVLIYKKDFVALNAANQKAGKPLYANARNLAAGTMRLLDTETTARRRLHFRAYEILGPDFPSWQALYAAFEQLMIAANPQAQLCQDLPSLQKTISQLSKLKDDLPFQTDGLVVKVNDYRLYQQLGSVTRSPRGGIAYKYPPDQTTSRVKDIKLQIGRTGVVTPVAVLEPVFLEGTMIQNASLHNADEIERLDVRLGDTVTLLKAGDIIPKIKAVLLDLRPAKTRRFNFEKALKQQFPELSFERLDDEVAYRLTADKSNNDWLLVLALRHYAARSALNIEGLGLANAQLLVEAGLVKDIADIYKLTAKQLQLLPRFADLSSQNLIKAIAAAKKPALDRFIFGLGIEGVGSKTATDLAQAFGSLDNFRKADAQSLQAIEGIGEKVANNILQWQAEKAKQVLLSNLLKYGVKPQKPTQSQGALSHCRLVITGTFQTFSRQGLKTLIEKEGGQVQSQISRQTSFLIKGDNPGPSKMKKARASKIRILSEQQFQAFINSSKG